MAFGVCEHCHSPIRQHDQVATRQGYSYHKKCHKCYVCSETDIRSAEVFKGVIFCASCAQRIFQGCSSARKTKQQANHRSRHERSRSRRKRDRRRVQEDRIDRNANGVIELAQLVESTSGSHDTSATKHAIKSSKGTPTAMPMHVEQQVYNFQPKKSLKTVSLDMGTTTIFTQNLLKQFNDAEISSFIKHLSDNEIYKLPIRNLQKNVMPEQPAVNLKINVTSIQPIASLQRNIRPVQPVANLQEKITPVELGASPHRNIPPVHPVTDLHGNVTPVRHRKKKKDIVHSRDNKQFVSDLRIAELGASTEIANMALRKKSELPVIIKSESKLKDISSDTLTMINQESEESKDVDDWGDSHYGAHNTGKIKCLDRRLGSIIKLPYRFFKKNILTRSSLISIAMSDSYRDSPFMKRLKALFYEEITEHRGRGIKRLYSTINRRQIPYKLGWLTVDPKAKALLECPTSHYQTVPRKPCKHFKASHSYRCMRAQAMRLAGPTLSQLALFRKRIKKFILPPKCIREIVKECLYDPIVEEEERHKKLALETVFTASSARKPNISPGHSERPMPSLRQSTVV